MAPVPENLSRTDLQDMLKSIHRPYSGTRQELWERLNAPTQTADTSPSPSEKSASKSSGKRKNPIQGSMPIHKTGTTQVINHMRKRLMVKYSCDFSVQDVQFLLHKLFDDNTAGKKDELVLRLVKKIVHDIPASMTVNGMDTYDLALNHLKQRLMGLPKKDIKYYLTQFDDTTTGGKDALALKLAQNFVYESDNEDDEEKEDDEEDDE